MSGFYLMHRDWMDNRVFARDAYCRRTAWVWMIEHAAWKDGTRQNGKLVLRGQLYVSYRYLAQAWGWSKSAVRRWIVAASDADMIRIDADTLACTITICNYDKYQSSDFDADTEPERTRHAPDTHPTRNRDKEEQGKKEQGKKEASRRGSRFENSGIDSLPAAWAVVCHELRPDLDPMATFERFRDYWLGKAGAAGVKADWLATWRNWLRNERVEGKPKETAQIHKLLTESDLTARGKRRVFGRDAELYAEEQNWPRKPRPFADVPMDWQPRRQA